MDPQKDKARVIATCEKYGDFNGVHFPQTIRWVRRVPFANNAGDFTNDQLVTVDTVAVAKEGDRLPDLRIEWPKGAKVAMYRGDAGERTHQIEKDGQRLDAERGGL